MGTLQTARACTLHAVGQSLHNAVHISKGTTAAACGISMHVQTCSANEVASMTRIRIGKAVE